LLEKEAKKKAEYEKKKEQKQEEQKKAAERVSKKSTFPFVSYHYMLYAYHQESSHDL
jgi:hypothetical protein